MKLRIKNTSRGSRGVTVGGELVFVDAGSTGEFTGASAAERDTAAEHPDLMVQSEHDGKWIDHFKPDMPEPKQWLAVATDSTGSNMRFIDLNDAEWFTGVALANERPEKAAGFTWSKIGGGKEASETKAPAKPAPTITKVEQPFVTPPAFDATALVEKNAPDVISALDGMTAENVAAVKQAELKRPGPARKGVLAAIDAAGKSDPFGG